MRTWHTTLTAGVFATFVAAAAACQAQQVTVGTPFHTLSDSFFESNSVNWSGHIGGINFSYGGGVLARPQFGQPDPTAGLSTNFAILGKNTQINFATNFSQGYRQTLVTQTPSVTLMNGQTGYISNISQTPFVMSYVPVVGGFPAAAQQFPPLAGSDLSAIDPRVQAMLEARAAAQPDGPLQDGRGQVQVGGQGTGPVPPPPRAMNPRRHQELDPPAAPDPSDAALERLDAAQESTAGRPALSVAEARRLHQQETAAVDDEMAALMERAHALEDDGKPNVAKIYYQRIAKHATGQLQQQARTRLYELQGSGK